MIYVKLNSNGEIEKYPYNLYDLRVDFPNTSFTIPVEEDSLNSRGIFRVAESVMPQIDHTKELVELQPTLQNGTWTRVWSVVDALPEHIQTRFDAAAYDIRKRRNELLSSTDWTQVADTPVDKQTWATYRQALRNITTQSNFPWSVEWPTQPV
jgi:hypothetical protein